MVMHARSGGAIEIMGLMQGYVSGDSIMVTDAFRLPVEGTETRVNAQDDANEYMVNFTSSARDGNRPENVVGWYHSHPGYGCWLSGIDVSTQHLQQQFQDPFVAVVIDPDRTVSAGRVEIGAFRTFPEDYKAESSGTDSEGFQTIPLGKVEDFGAHSERYYALEVSHYKSSLDTKVLESLWNKYWVGTLSSSPLFTNREYTSKQIEDLGLKMLSSQGGSWGARSGPLALPSGRQTHSHDEQLSKILKAGNKLAAEEESGLLASHIKEKLFRGIEAQQSPDDVNVTG